MPWSVPRLSGGLLDAVFKNDRANNDGCQNDPCLEGTDAVVVQLESTTLEQLYEIATTREPDKEYESDEE